MPREAETALRAPVVQRLYEILRKQLRHKPPESDARYFVITDGAEQLEKLIEQLVAVFLLIFFRKNKAPRNPVS